jgi:hypothetical protein
MENSKKKEIIKEIQTLAEEIEDTIKTNQYEPSERGAGFATREEAMEEVTTAIEVFTIELLAKFGIKENLIDETKFDNILEKINKEKIIDLDCFDEIEEIEVRKDAEIEDKYIYKTIYLFHKKENRTLAVLLQCDARNEYPDNFERAYEVKKEQITITEYQEICPPKQK